MKNFFVSIIIYFLSATSIYSHVEHYSDFNELKYELFRNDKLIGYHNYDFIRNGSELVVKSDVKFKIRKLGVDLYNYEAKSEEVYENNKFIKFSSKTNQNKKQKYVNIVVESKNQELLVDGSSFKGKTSVEHIVGTWWNHEIVKAKAQISAISGRVIQQKVTFVGKEDISIDGKAYKCLHFNFASSDENLPKEKKLNTDIWYEESSRMWIKASFKKSGNWEYRLKSKK